MLILGIDTSASPCCAAVYDDEKQTVLAETVINNKLTHSVTLMPVVQSLLANAEISCNDIDLFAAAVGPGSFTGLRIGISAVKGMAFAAGKPCAAVTATEAMAYNITLCDCVVCAAIDARCGRVYNALFSVHDGQVKRLCEERCQDAEELAQELCGYKEKVILVGDGAQQVFEKAQALSGDNISLSPEQYRYQTGRGVCLAARDKERLSPEALMPMYLKLPQAQRELMAKQGSKCEE